MRRDLKDSLALIHRYNAVFWLLLASTGLLLYLPGLRGTIAPWRVAIKQAHVWIGIGSLVFLFAYLPYATRHWRELARLLGKKINVIVTVLLLLGWVSTGILLAIGRAVPVEWAAVALDIHGLLSLAGAIWAVAHAMLRHYELNLALPWSVWPPQSIARASLHPVFRSRRKMLRQSGVMVFALLLASLGLLRWSQLRAAERHAEQLDLYPAWLRPKPSTESDPPIGGGAEGVFRIYTVTAMPKLDLINWAMPIDGLVMHPQNFTWQQFLDLKRTVQVSDFRCVTGWRVRHVTWEGILLSDLLEFAGPLPQAKSIKFYSNDGVYTDAILLEELARMPDVIVAFLLDGQPLTRDQGGPARLVVPQMYGYKSVKWLGRIEATKTHHIGYWEERGYKSDAWLETV